MSSPELVLCQRQAAIATLTINRPEKLNALNREVLGQLGRQLETVLSDDAVRVVILTGAGDKAFVAGADIAEMSPLTPRQAMDFSRLGQSIATTIDRFNKPVIAAVNGFALGGGCELALSCHIRLASAQAQFGQPEVGLGLIPGFGGTQRLARIIGEARALELIASGRRIDAATALSYGLVNAIATEKSVLQQAEELARSIAAQSPVAVRLAVEAVRAGLSMPLSEALEFEAALFGLTFSTADMREGTRAFLEKRKPQFEGR
jgi:enoyl-CoA hydratase